MAIGDKLVTLDILKNVSDNVNNLTQETLVTSTLTSSNIWFYKIGKIVVVYIPPIVSQTIAQWESVDICTIPVGFEPFANPSTPIPRQNVTTTMSVFYRIINNKLVIHNQSDSSITTGNMMEAIHIYLTT